MPSLSRISLCYLALAGVSLLIYGPALSGGFLWDDTDWIRDNETLRTAGGLWRIWFEPGAVIQYYPLTYTSWWLDCQLWGLSPAVMHVENVLLHAANALLFGLLLRRLLLPGAWIAAVIFLVHPVHAESVAWLVERKNTLSGLLYLGACHQWLSHLDAPTKTTRTRAGLLFLAALFAKTATLMLPVTLFAIAIWRQRRWQTSLRALLPFVAVAVLAAAVTVVMERGEGAVGYDWALTVRDRIALVGQVVGFYFGKLLWPSGLSFSYAKWTVGGSLVGWLPTLILLTLTGISVVAVVRMRRPVAVAASLAFWVYLANLLPVTGLVDYYYLRYAFVADHFQYLSSMGPIALLVCGCASVAPQANLFRVLCIAVATLLATFTWSRAHIYQDLEVLWRETIEAEPDSWLAHSNLGNLLDRRGGPDAGIDHHRRALAIYPDAFEDNNALGNYHARHGDFASARQFFDVALRVRPDDPLTYNNLGAMHGMQGDYQEALGCFDAGYRRSPDNRDLLRNLAVVLAQAPDPTVRDGARALRLATKLNQVDRPSLLDEHVLFRAMLLAVDRDRALQFGDRVMHRARREGDHQLARRIGEQISRLRK